MSVNYPSGMPDNAADPGNRTNSTGRSIYEDAAKQDTKRKMRGGDTMSLRNDLSTLKDDLDELLSNASTLTDTELQEAYGKMMTKFSTMRYAAKGLAAEATRHINQGVDITSDYVKDRPLQSVAVAAGIGLILGVVLGRR